jgi:hypothetical protein
MLPTVMQGVKLNYTAGYLIDWPNEGTATHTLPYNLTMACTELVAHKYNERQSQGVSSQTTEGQSVTFNTNKDKSGNPIGMPVSVKQVLGLYQTFRYAV